MLELSLLVLSLFEQEVHHYLRLVLNEEYNWSLIEVYQVWIIWYHVAPIDQYENEEFNDGIKQTQGR